MTEPAFVSLAAVGPPNTGDKLRSGARVLPRRRGHEAAPPAERRLRREGWCRRKLRQLHPLVLRRPSFLATAGLSLACSVRQFQDSPCSDLSVWYAFETHVVRAGLDR